VKEAELQSAVVSCARLLGYRVAHFGIGLSRKGWRTPAHADAAGFPDLVLVGRGRVLYRELKVGRNRLPVEQGGWLDALADCGQDVGVWREIDWHSGLVESELRGEELAARAPVHPPPSVSQTRTPC
jgi:hypothetical protein